MNTHQISTRLNQVGFSDIVTIRNRVMDLRAAGKPVFEFQGGEPFMPSPEPVKEAMIKALREDKTRYAPSSGIAELRTAIAEKLNTKNHINAPDTDIIVTNGGTQALFVAFQTILNPRDEVLLFSPYWTPIADMIRACEAAPVFVSTADARADGFIPTLEKHLTPNTKLIYFNTPNNPTGDIFARDEAEQVAAFAIKNNLLVIADEAYEDLIYDEAEHFSIASLQGMYERTISTYTFSKSYSMTGYRIGYAVAPAAFMSGLQRLTLYSTNGVSTATQYAALAALQLPTSYLDDSRRAYLKRRNLLVGELNELGFECAMPQGAFYAFPNVSRIHTDSRQAFQILLDRAQIATVAGNIFGIHGESHVRMSYSLPLETIEQGLESLRKNFA